MQKPVLSPSLPFLRLAVTAKATVAGKAAPTRSSSPGNGAPKAGKGPGGASPAGGHARVTASRGSSQRGKRGHSKHKDSQDRQRLSGSLQLKRIRQVLDGSLSPAQALSLIFSAPGVWMGNPIASEQPDSVDQFYFAPRATTPVALNSLLDNQGFLLSN